MNVLMLRHNLHQMVLEQADEVYAVLDGSPGCRALSEQTLERFAGVYRVSSYDSLEELSAVVADLTTRGVRIDKVVSLAEFTQYAAAYAAHLLGLDHYAPGIALATRDKRVTKARAVEAGLEVARWVAVPQDPRDRDARAIAEAVGLPLVLKPASGWGTISTVKVDDLARLERVLADFTVEPGVGAPHVIAEEFIDGDEYHVDAVWRAGEPWFFHVSRYVAPRLKAWLDSTYDGSVLLAEDDHAELYGRLRDLSSQFNKAVGLTRGATHLEVFRERSTGRLVVSDVASRMGGAHVPEVTEAKCGVHEGRAVLHELLDGEREDLPWSRPAFRYVGGLSITPAESGKIVALPDRDELLAHPHVVHAVVYRAVGDTVEVSHPSGWCVLVVVGADTEEELLAVNEDLVARYRVEVA
ncbi:ATP-grasp domain-containing protein [Streptomyces sp. NRRL S-31]|uniref:ATP-grasp domain-containing protein n=1 Tax=Streptomyces sp. NRRL S-31 TaxID=1463898 RepID=UPI00069BF32C|nr:ATP-grasp domain-containing protein [Streptomyces sp. NRRL S-31]